jgi:hypothetical protein
VHYTKRLTVFQNELVIGKPQRYAFQTVQMSHSPFATVTQSKQLKVSLAILHINSTLYMHPAKYFQIQVEQIAYTRKCGQASGGMHYR